VATMAAAIGQTLDMTRIAAQRLVLAALLHDAGHSCALEEVEQSTRAAWEVERERAQQQSLRRAQYLLDVGNSGAVLPIVNVLLSQHANGKPQQGKQYCERPEEVWLGRLLHVLDRFENLTRGSGEGQAPMRPDQALSVLIRAAGSEFDCLGVKALVRTLGLYPPGTLVQLSTGEEAIVVRRSHDFRTLHRPQVRVLQEDRGRGGASEPLDLDLNARQQDSLAYKRHVMHSIDLGKAGGTGLLPFLAKA